MMSTMDGIPLSQPAQLFRWLGVGPVQLLLPTGAARAGSENEVNTQTGPRAKGLLS